MSSQHLSRFLAVIPARGGSKRLPGKNIMPLGGRPLLAWSILLAQRLPSVVECVVSTDDEAIAAVAGDWGATVVRRPAELATDDSSSVDALIHAARARRDITAFDAVMLLQPTNPLRPLADILDAVRRFDEHPCDSLMAVSRRQLKFGSVEGGYFSPSYVIGTQSRLTSDSIYENGMLYLTRADVLLDKGSMTGDRILAFETRRPYEDIDIDDAVDLMLAEAILSAVRDTLGY